jgi:hypothetical protein
MVVKDMIFNRETAQRIYDASYGSRADGNCKVNETCFCNAYPDTTALNVGTVVATSFDRITKSMTVGTPQVIAAFDCKEMRSIYIEDNKICVLYIDSATGELFGRVATISGTVFTFGTEFSVHNYDYQSSHLEATRIDSTHIAVLISETNQIDSNVYVAAIAFSISGVNLDTAGNVLEIDQKSSTLVYDSDLGISAFNSSSIGITWINDNTLLSYTVKLELSGVTLSLIQTPLQLADIAEAYPNIGCLQADKALVGYTNDSRTTLKQRLTLIDYSGSTPEILDTVQYEFDKQIFWRFAIVSKGSAIVIIDARDTTEVLCSIWNVYGNTILRNYALIDIYFADKMTFGVHVLNSGEFVLFTDVLSIPTTLYNIDANLISFLGGVSMPDFTDFNDVDFDLVEIGQSSTIPVTLLNDGLYPEDIELTSTKVYFNDDNDLLSRNASVRVRSIPILTNEDYDYLTDPKGNVLKAIY